MKQRKSLLLLFCVFVLSIGTKASNSLLQFGVTTFSQDTLYYGDTLFFHTYLINNGPDVYYDSVGFGLKINNTVNINRSLFPDPLFGQAPIFINSGDSIPLEMRIIISPAYLEVGPDILVVWPICTCSSGLGDAFEKQIYILIPTGFEPIDPTGNWKVFWWQSHIWIKNDSPENGLNQVRIFNIAGQLMEELPYEGNSEIPFTYVPAGIYFVEISNAKERRVFKIVKTTP